jgi:hypothetical protein
LEVRTPTFLGRFSPAFSFGRLPFSEAPQAPAMALDLFLGADHDNARTKPAARQGDRRLG